MKVDITCKFREWCTLAEGFSIDADYITVYLEDVPSICENTLGSMFAPKGWAIRMWISDKTWTWETLGKPDVDPNDHRKLVELMLKAEWPTVKFVLPPEEPSVQVSH